MKIGITLALKDNKESIWTNGIKQNVLMLVHMLKQSDKNYEVCILNTNDVDFTERPNYLNDIDVYHFDSVFMEMDLIIVMGAQIHDTKLKQFKESGDKKVIAYKCGNNYMISVENILFKENDKSKKFQYEREYDEIWYIPQQHESNSGLYKTLYRTNAIIIPFIWSERFLLEAVTEIHKGFQKGTYKKDWQYEIGKEKKILGIMEPNINLIKFCLIPALIAEESYRGEIGKNHIERLRITNANRVKENKEFLSMIGTFDLYKDGRISAESRYQTAYILTQHLDVLISHQVANPLNYLYLDAVFLGYPILHNAPLVKDLGYYYEDGDTIQGAKQLDYILTEHDKNIEEYDERNDKVLQRYHIYNKDIIETYDRLIEGLWNGGNHDLIYNPSTNLYDNL
jgi:hypothetical protein